MRVVLCSVYPPAYRLVASWARQHGHELRLLITVPQTGGARGGLGSPAMPVGVPDEQDVVVTSRLVSTAAPLVAALESDLLISATFPRRIPGELVVAPRFGAVNLHPSPLPRGRGPNPARIIYDGEPTIGATLHWLTPEFDAGAVLARVEEPAPAVPTAKRLRDAWVRLQRRALELGVPRAEAGQAGEPQDEALVTYAPRFTSAERWLSWDESATTILRRIAALGVHEPTACARVGEQPMRILRAHRAAEATADATGRERSAPGTVLTWRRHLDSGVDVVTVQSADAPVTIRGQRLREA